MLILLTLLGAFVAQLKGRTYIALALVLITGGLLVSSPGLLGQALNQGVTALTWIGHQADKLA